jgi:hypothetical protein
LSNHRRISRDRTVIHVSFGRALLQWWWVLGGNIALIVTTIVIAVKFRSALSWVDAIPAAIVVSLVAARYLGGDPMTGENSTSEELRKYAAALALLFTIVLGIIHVLGATTGGAF